ncbi:MAG: hypothetical protein NC411_05050 [Bacteroides sp.]|nr:hypothetical protein [Bacteroides sp.]
MNTRIASIILCITAACTTAVSAQGLHKEIDVDRKIDPLKRDAARITVLPTLQLPSIDRRQLSFSDRVVTSRIPTASPILQPMAYGDKIYTSPYRGYVTLGLGAPSFIADFSAGYRILNSEKTRLNLWSQYCGDVYSATMFNEDYKKTWNDQSAAIGLDFGHKLGKSSELSASLDYDYGYHNVPAYVKKYGQNTSRANAQIGFASNGDGIKYHADIRYRHFGFYHISLSRIDLIAGGTNIGLYDGKPVRQNTFGGSAGVILPIGDDSDLRLDVDADFLRSGLHHIPIYPYDSTSFVEAISSSTSGLVGIHPAYTYRTSTASAEIGAEINISSNADKTFHIAPEVTLSWTPSQIFGIEVKATGGSQLNSLSSLYDVSPYLCAYMAYGQSHIPYNLDARFSVGTLFGGYLELFGGYAKANDWLMPVFSESYPGYGIYDPVDLSAWHVGAAIGYDYRKVFSLRLSYETAPNDYDKSYHEWRDRAKHVVNANLNIRPISPLLVTVNWEFRAGRRMYAIESRMTGGDLPGHIYTPVAMSLNCVSDLSIGAGYSFSDRLTVFARGENILNRRYSHIGLRTSQGVHALIGASLKF